MNSLSYILGLLPTVDISNNVVFQLIFTQTHAILQQISTKCTESLHFLKMAFSYPQGF